MAGHTDTIVAIATPPGRGGLGIVRVSGPAALEVAGHISSSKRDWIPRQGYYCNIHDQEGVVIDSGILLFFAGPASYTGEDVLEIHAHGSRVVLGRIVEHVLSLGGRLAGPGEFTERAFLNGKMDLVQAEAVADLIDAVSEQAARSAMRSLQGEFSRLVNILLEEIVQARTLVEGALDFPDEDIDFLAEGNIGEQLEAINSRIDDIMSQAQQGAILREGVHIAIVGRPNVGKSTLLNRLAGRDAAIVTEIAGTTRDPVVQDLVIDGVPIHLVDTAGLRVTTDAIEQEGIRRTRNTMSDADIVIHMLDYNDTGNPGDPWLQETAGKKRLLVLNKIDLQGTGPALETSNGETAVLLSAKTGEGMDLFMNELRHQLGLQELSENSFMARKRHIDALEKTQHYMRRAMAVSEEQDQPDVLAEELRQAQGALSEITGKFTADDLLGSIFSSFCIGK